MTRPGMGRVRRVDPRDANYPLRSALRPRAAKVAPIRRRWRLQRSWQLDQGATSECVAFTGKHWELSLPICSRVGLPPDELYRRCKAVDGYPGEDGTDARTLMKVYQQLRQVGAYHWYTGDLGALKLWLLTESPAWFGAYWTPEMLDPPPSGILTVGEPDPEMGHEVLLIGYDRPRDLFQICNSWGTAWGREGRAYIRGPDLKRLLDADGDCVVAQEARVGT